MEMLDTGVLNMPSGQPLCQANKELVVKNMSDILADHFSSKTGKNLEVPVKKSRGRPAGTPNSTPSAAGLRSSLKELGLSTSGKKPELKARLEKAVSQGMKGDTTYQKSKKTKKDKKNKKDKKDKKDKHKVKEPDKRGRKKGAKNKHPSKTKKNTAAAIVIQARVRSLLAKNAYVLAAAKKAALVSKKKTKKSASKMIPEQKKKKTKSSQ